MNRIDRCDIHFDYDWYETNTYLSKITNEVIYLLKAGDEYLVTLNEIKVDAMKIIFKNDSIDLVVSNENDSYQTWRGTIPTTWTKKGSFSVVMTINDRNILLYQGLMNMITYDSSSTFNILVDIPNNFITSSDDSLNVVRTTDGNFVLTTNLEFTSSDNSIIIEKDENTYNLKTTHTSLKSSDNSVEITKDEETNTYDLKVKVSGNTSVTSTDKTINVTKVDGGYDLGVKGKVGNLIKSVTVDTSNLNVDVDFTFTPSGDINITEVEEDINTIDNVGTLATFTQGQDEFNQGSLSDFTQGEDAYTSSNLVITTNDDEELVFNFTQGSFTQGQDTFIKGTLPSFTQGVDNYTDAILPSILSKKVLTDVSATLTMNETKLNDNFNIKGDTNVTYIFEDKDVTFNA